MTSYIAINKIETNNSFQQCPIIATDYHYALPRLSCYMLLHLLQYLLVYKTFRYTTNVNSKRILLIIFLHSSDLGAIRFHFRRVRIILLGKAGLANTYPDFFFPWKKKTGDSEHLLPQIVRHVLYPSEIIKNRLTNHLAWLCYYEI